MTEEKSELEKAGAFYADTQLGLDPNTEDNRNARFSHKIGARWLRNMLEKEFKDELLDDPFTPENKIMQKGMRLVIEKSRELCE